MSRTAILIGDPALLSPVAPREVVFLFEAVTLQSFQEQRPARVYILLTARNEEMPKKGRE